MVIKKVSAIVTLWVVLVLSVNARAHDERDLPQKLLVGTMIAPPFAMKTADGRWEGLAIELWQEIAQVLGVEYEVVEYNNFGRIIKEVEKGELDVCITLAVTEPREAILDFSHPFLTSGSAIAVPAVVSGHSLFYFTGHFVERFVSSDFLLLIGILVLVSLAAGTTVWLFKNELDGLQAIVGGKIDAFVYDELVLKYLAKTEFSGRIHVLPEIFDHYYLSIAVPQGSPLREPLDRALLKIIDTDDYLRLKERHIGPGR